MDQWLEVWFTIAFTHMVAYVKIVSNVITIKQNIDNVILFVNIIKIKFDNTNSGICDLISPRSIIYIPFNGTCIKSEICRLFRKKLKFIICELVSHKTVIYYCIWIIHMSWVLFMANFFVEMVRALVYWVSYKFNFLLFFTRQ